MHERAQVDVMRVHALPVERRVGGQGDGLLGDETLGLGLQFASTGVERFGRRLGTDDDADAPDPSIGLTTSSARWSIT